MLAPPWSDEVGAKRKQSVVVFGGKGFNDSALDVENSYASGQHGHASPRSAERRMLLAAITERHMHEAGPFNQVGISLGSVMFSGRSKSSSSSLVSQPFASTKS